MILSAALLGFVFFQQPRPIRVKVFPGGTFDDYVKLVRLSHPLHTGINVYSENIFVGMGPTRLISYDDGSLRLDPGLPSYLKLGQEAPHGYLKSSLWPSPYCRPVPMKKVGEEQTDKIRILRLNATDKLLPEIDASLRIGNGLSSLGYAVKIHPFFRDMWVHVTYVGNWRPSILNAIGDCIGATVRVQKGVPDTYLIEPDVEEIRRRSLATLDYFTPIDADEAGTLREDIRYELLKNCSSAFLKRWIDAAGKPEEVPLPSAALGKEILHYREILIHQMRTSNPELPFLQKYSDDAINAMPVLLFLQGYLELDIRLIGPDGLPIHI